MLERDAPRVAGWSLAVLVDQNRNAAVDRLGDLRVAPGAEDRAGPRVGIQQLDVVRRKRDVPLLIFQFFDVVDEEHEVGCLYDSCSTAEIQDAELERRMNVRKEDLLVLEVVQPNQPIRFGDRREEILGRLVGRDARGREQPDAAVRGDQLIGQFGEHRVGVDVALAGERIFVRSCGNR